MESPRIHAASVAAHQQPYASDGRGATPQGVTLSLLEWRPPEVAPRAAEQPKQLARVAGRLGLAILDWCRANVGRDFHLEEITLAVQAEVTCAPDSVRRVLAQLRREGHVQVELLSRSASLYRVVW